MCTCPSGGGGGGGGGTSHSDYTSITLGYTTDSDGGYRIRVASASWTCNKGYAGTITYSAAYIEGGINFPSWYIGRVSAATTIYVDATFHHTSTYGTFTKTVYITLPVSPAPVQLPNPGTDGSGGGSLGGDNTSSPSAPSTSTPSGGENVGGSGQNDLPEIVVMLQQEYQTPGITALLTAYAKNYTSLQWYQIANGVSSALGSGNATTYSVELTAPGTYTYQCVATNSTGSSSSNVIAITIPSPPTIVLTAEPAGGVVPISVRINAATTNTSNIVWYQSIDSGVSYVELPETENLILRHYSANDDVGNYLFKCTATGIGGVTTSEPLQISISESPIPTVSVVANKTDVTTQSVVTLTAVTTHAYSWLWQLSTDGQTFTYVDGASDAVYSPVMLAIGTYRYRCVVTGVGGIAVSNPVIIRVVTSSTKTRKTAPIRVISSAGVTTAVLSRVQYVRYFRSYSDGDEIQVSLSTYDFKKLDLVIGTMLAVHVLNKWRLCIITRIYGDSKKMVTLYGMEYSAALFSRRICLTNVGNSDKKGYDEKTDYAETLVRYWMAANIPSGNRSAPSWSLAGVDQQRGGITSYSARFETTAQVLKKVLAAGNLGYDSYLSEVRPTDGLSVVCSIISGTDRGRSGQTSTAAAVVFSDEWGTGELLSFEEKAGPNVVYAGGGGSGADRTIATAGETTKTGMDRFEMFADCKEAASSDTELLSTLGLRSMAEEQQKTVKFRMLPGGAYTLGEDFAVGDIVTVACEYGTFDTRVTEAEMSWSASGEEINLTLGVVTPDIVSVMGKAAFANKDARR